MRVVHRLDQISERESFDAVVIGAGAAGMAAALFTALAGRSVLLVESMAQVGGTSAWSAGSVWIPGTTEGFEANPDDSIDAATLYLDAAVGAHAAAPLRQAFLAHGPQAVAELNAHSDVRFRAYPRHPDYLADLPGATLSGRALEPLPFDGRKLGKLLALIREPIPEFTVLGGMMVDRTDIQHLLALHRSWRSFCYSTRLLYRHFVDRTSHARGTRLVMGNALVGRLLLSLSKQARVTLVLQVGVQAMGVGRGSVDTVVLQQANATRTVHANGGVVLATGGFNRHPDRRAALIGSANEDWCPGAPGHTGALHGRVESLGGHYGQGGLSPAFWAPVSLRKRPDGSRAVFPHFVMDRGKPGMMVVNHAGRRFLNESEPYHLFGLSLLYANGRSPSIPAYLICDHEALRRYGLGMIRPGGRGLRSFLEDGYLTRADSVEALAHALGVNAENLRSSVERMNGFAASGVDTDFGRGHNAYQRNIGDASRSFRNPNLGPLATPPFYAIRIYPGDIGAATGFATDTHVRVVEASGEPIAGLYAIGADMHSIMGGVYPGPGITLGPAITFASLAAKDIAARASR